MGIYEVAEGAFFVPSYSLQTIAPAYDTATTVQSLGPQVEADDRRDVAGAVDTSADPDHK